jgi:hypothetical protein
VDLKKLGSGLRGSSPRQRVTYRAGDTRAYAGVRRADVPAKERISPERESLMFATLKPMRLYPFSSVARNRRRERATRPAVEGLERRQALSVSTPIVATLVPVATTPAPAPILHTASGGAQDRESSAPSF